MSKATLSLFLVLCLPISDRLIARNAFLSGLEQHSFTHESAYGLSNPGKLSNSSISLGSAGQSGKWQLFEGEAKFAVELDLECFEVSPVWTQINTNFSIIYQFEIGLNNHPAQIRPMAGQQYIDAKKAELGLAKWKFIGLEKGRWFALVLNWRHAAGYVSMFIISEQVSIMIRLQKNWEIPD